MMITENTIIRDYKILHQIGEGGMGKVYLAEDLMLDRKVALKILNPMLIQDSQFTERFRQEAKLQSSLVHPNIVSLYTFFLEAGNYCMVMEYAEGFTLKELISKTGPLPENRSRKILLPLLDALGYAHSKGIIHRDIKPSNIIIDSSDNVKVMDFGIAKILGDKGMTKTGAKVGTIYYMSPEQIRAEKEIDQRTDIYSLGITFYEMLTGRIPFNIDTESDFAIMEEIVHGVLKNPKEIITGLSQMSVDLVYMMTEKDKLQRPVTCYQCGEYLHGKEYQILPEEKITSIPKVPFTDNPKSYANDQFTKKSFSKIEDFKLISNLKPKEGFFKSLLNTVYSVSISSDGRYVVASYQDNSVWLWDILDGTRVQIIKNNCYAIYSVKFSPDSKYIAFRTVNNNVTLWEVSPGKINKFFSEVENPLKSVSFSPDGKLIVCGCSKGVKIWEIDSFDKGNLFPIDSCDTTCAIYSPNGKFIASGLTNGSIWVLEAETGNKIKKLQKNSSSIQLLSFSHDGKLIGSINSNQALTIWEIDSGKEIASDWISKDFAYSLKFNPCGSYILTGHFGAKISVSDIETGRVIKTLIGDSGLKEAFNISKDGKYIVSALPDHSINIWEIKYSNK